MSYLYPKSLKNRDPVQFLPTILAFSILTYLLTEWINYYHLHAVTKHLSLLRQMTSLICSPGVNINPPLLILKNNLDDNSYC